MRKCLTGVALLLAAACGGGAADTTAGSSPRPTAVVAAPLGSVAPVQASALLQAKLTIDGGPDYLAVTGDAAWVKADDGWLHRIDPATNRVTRRIRLGAELCQGMGASDDAVWACDDKGVARVDSRRGVVTARVEVGRVREQGTYPVGHGRIWVIGGDATTLTGIDLTTNEVVTEVPLGTRCGSAAVSTASVWVTCRNDNLLLRIDPVKGEVSDRTTALESPSFVSASGDTLVVAYRDGVARVDPATGRVMGAVRASTEFGMALATPDSIWVRSKEAYLRELDPGSLALVRDVQSPEKISGSVAVGFGSVWASGADDRAGTVLRLRR